LWTWWPSESVKTSPYTKVRSRESAPSRNQAEPTADVIIIRGSPALPSQKLGSLIGSVAGGFASPSEVDDFIRQEGDAWPT